MKTIVTCIALALAACARVQGGGDFYLPTSSRGAGGPKNKGNAGVGKFQGHKRGGSSLHGAGIGGYQAIPYGYQTSEGENVDPELLEKIGSTLLREEASSGFGGRDTGSYFGPHLSSYGAPSTSSRTGRVVAIKFGGVHQATQVAQYVQTLSHSFKGGFPAVSGSYGAH